MVSGKPPHYSRLLRIIVSCGFSLFDLHLPLLPLSPYTPLFLRDIICFHTTRREKQLSMGWSKTINDYKNIFCTSISETEKLFKRHFSPLRENYAIFSYIICVQNVSHTYANYLHLSFFMNLLANFKSISFDILNIFILCLFICIVM